jgi:CBS domain-containing protein
MPRPQAVKNKLQDQLQGRLDELKTLRDTIRVDLRLASMDLKDEWKNLETRLPDPAVAVEQVKEVTSETIDRLVAELRGFRSRLRPAGGEGQAGKTVERLMTSSVVTCTPGDNLARAVILMFDHDIGWMPVVGEGGSVVGVITDRDAAVASATRSQRMNEIGVSSVMSTNVVACSPQASTDEALALMRAQRVRRIVVLAEGKLAGVVSLNDLARASGREGAAVSAPEVVQALIEIATPGGRPGSN